LIPLGSNAGQIVVNGQKLAHWSLRELAKQRAYLPQGRHDVFGYRVIDTVLAARYAYTEGHYWDSAENVGIANDALSQLDVADLAERDVRSLSGGERQRVAIAALLAQNAPLMLLDEPGNALDLPHQIRAMQLISDGCRVQQKSVVMVSHDVNLVYRIATHALLLMPDGSWQAGRASEIMNPSMLAECLGHPIERVQHGKHQVFLPV
jgi:iron complex transport system ATP-binding protein